MFVPHEHVCVCMMCRCVHITAYMWISEDHSGELFFFLLGSPGTDTKCFIKCWLARGHLDIHLCEMTTNIPCVCVCDCHVVFNLCLEPNPLSSQVPTSCHPVLSVGTSDLRTNGQLFLLSFLGALDEYANACPRAVP